MVGLLAIKIAAAGFYISADSLIGSCHLILNLKNSISACDSIIEQVQSGRSSLKDAQDELMRYRAKEQQQQLRSMEDFQTEYQLSLEQLRKEDAANAAKKKQADEEINETYRRVREDLRNHAERERAERERQHQRALEQARQDSERLSERLRAEGEARAKYAEELARERAKPESQLRELYQNYIGVKRCYDSREGKVYIYVDAADLTDAKQKTQLIERQIILGRPDIDQSSIWEQAQELQDDFLWIPAKTDIENGELTPEGQAFCRASLSAIRQNFLRRYPESNLTQKDF